MVELEQLEQGNQRWQTSPRPAVSVLQYKIWAKFDFICQNLCFWSKIMFRQKLFSQKKSIFGWFASACPWVYAVGVQPTGYISYHEDTLEMTIITLP